MREQEAENLVTNTFTQSYDETRFRRFINELFHDYVREDKKASSGKYIPEAFKRGVQSYKRLAKFTDPDGLEVDVLAVKISHRNTLENARTMQRNFIARYLNGSRGGEMKDAALVAFYSDDCDDWRFSLVRMDYVLDEEKQKIHKELTPARRYSFLVGRHEKTHTARKQLLPALQSKTETTLTELETAFNIETVTKEFFEQYKALYLKLKNTLEKNPAAKAEFAEKSIKAEDFAKRLLGQIVFLYFLQKKGWLGVTKEEKWGTGPKDFLQSLHLSKCESGENFFNDVLEPLFYEALATKRRDNYYDHLKCRIPFLNGGLFEPISNYDWKNTDIRLDNAIFQKIFKVFDLYNFTVREDEPLDKEVAVDPEMLGKVFENLIPENERKGSGTYYTPREVVHYMCQESLINYLDAKLNMETRPIEGQGQQSLIPDTGKIDLLTKYEDIYTPIVSREDLTDFIYHGDVVQEHDATAQIKTQQEGYKGDYQYKIPEAVRKYASQIDDALADVKICDPAIGSGAFPLGVMNEIVRARGLLNAYLGVESRAPYDFKRHAIQESIYGVDIEPSAVDIAKLRLWLSLVVDEEDFENIQPLPNLDYKIVSGNSLIGFPFGTHNQSAKLRKLTPLKDEYFNASTPAKKSELRNKINAIIESEYNNSNIAKSLGHKVDFDFRWSFFEVFDANAGFDIVIANPPYLESRSKEFDATVKNLYQDNLKHQWPDSFKMIPRGSDLMMYFYPKALRILNPKGTGCFITENSWLDTDYGNKFQSFILSEASVKAIIDSKHRYFSGKDAPNINTIISLFSHKNSVLEKTRFVHVNDNISKVNHSLAFVEKDIENLADVRVFEQDDLRLIKYKWGFLFRIPDWMEAVLDTISKMSGTSQESIEFGQGLNGISGDQILSNEFVSKNQIQEDVLLPFFTKVNSFKFDRSTDYLCNASKSSNKVKNLLKQSNLRTFNPNKTTKKPPIFIMPRGIGRHFCAINSCNAYSSSCVEIYENQPLSEGQKVAIWAFCNSSLYWLLRELTGRTNLGGGMLKSEATDVSKILIPFDLLSEKKEPLKKLLLEMSQREPLNTLKEINTPEHRRLDKIILSALNLSSYEEKIREELTRQIEYRGTKSQT